MKNYALEPIMRKFGYADPDPERFFRDMFEKYGTVAMVARVTGISESSVRKYALEYGIDRADGRKLRPGNHPVEKKAMELGYASEEEFLRAAIKKYNTAGAAARAYGLKIPTVQAIARRLGIRGRDPKREKWDEKREKWNKKHGTNYRSTMEWLYHLAGEFGAPKAAKIAGCRRDYVNMQRRMYSLRLRNVKPVPSELRTTWSDERPSNLTEPWTDPRRSPCSVCRFSTRDKSNPGCVRCQRRLEYVALLAGGPVGSRTQGEASPYRGGGIHGTGYQEVY